MGDVLALDGRVLRFGRLQRHQSGAARIEAGGQIEHRRHHLAHLGLAGQLGRRRRRQVAQHPFAQHLALGVGRIALDPVLGGVGPVVILLAGAPACAPGGPGWRQHDLSDGQEGAQELLGRSVGVGAHPDLDDRAVGPELDQEASDELAGQPAGLVGLRLAVDDQVHHRRAEHAPLLRARGAALDHGDVHLAGETRRQPVGEHRRGRAGLTRLSQEHAEIRVADRTVGHGVGGALARREAVGGRRVGRWPLAARPHRGRGERGPGAEQQDRCAAAQAHQFSGVRVWSLNSTLSKFSPLHENRLSV